MRRFTDMPDFRPRAVLARPFDARQLRHRGISLVELAVVCAIAGFVASFLVFWAVS